MARHDSCKFAEDKGKLLVCGFDTKIKRFECFLPAIIPQQNQRYICNYMEMVKLIHIMTMRYIVIYRFSSEFLHLDSEIIRWYPN